MTLSRRTFLQNSVGAACAATLVPPSLLASVVQRASAAGAEADPHVQTLSTGWEFYQGPLDATWQVWRSKELVTWQKVSLPHCFNHYDACDPETPAYRGPGWYRTQLHVKNPFASGRTLLYCEGAGQQASVYVGDHLIGTHVGGYDEFLFDITDACRAVPADAAVQVSILCDNSRDIQRMPSDLSDFTLYGGLYRSVHLVYAPAISLEAVHTHVSFSPGETARVSVTARLYSVEQMEKQLDLQLSIYAPNGDRVHQQKVQRRTWSGETELASFELKSPELWSPQHPSLYRCEVTLTSGVDVSNATHCFGVRHAAFLDHGPFHLNGERLALRGTHRHEDHAGYAAAMPHDLIRKEMQMVKEMGANFIRLGHYQQSAIVLDLCDELGLLVWEEVPWCRSGVGSELFQERGRTLLRTMIDQHRNHPSIILWGLGNEDDWPGEVNGEDHDAIRRYMKELHDLAHSLDPSRFTSYRRCDFARDIPDVYSPSIWAGWYSGSYTEYRSALEKARKDVPHLIHIEWGADSHTGRYTEDPDPALAQILTGRGTAEQGLDYKLNGGTARISKDGTWSETYACDLFDWYLKTLEELPWLSGAAQWIFKDFTTPLRVDNPIPRINQKGLVERDMTPKEGYFVFQSYWSQKPMIRIHGHRWPVRWGKAGQERLVRVYSNCESVELFLNGKTAGVKRRDPQDFPAAGLRWSLAFREGENELRAVSRKSGVEVSDTVNFVYQTQAWGAPAKLLLTLKSSDATSATVEARTVDGSGVRCLDSRAVVSFSMVGAGRLLDNLGTSRGSRIVQLYNGRAEITLSRVGPVVASVASGE